MRAATYRKFLAVETLMMRATMPRAAAVEAAQPRPAASVVVIANRGNTRLVRPLTATIAEYVVVSGAVRDKAVR